MWFRNELSSLAEVSLYSLSVPHDMGFILSDFLSYKSPIKIKTKNVFQKRFNPARFVMSPDHRFILLAHNIQKVSTNTATTNKY